MSDNQQNLNKTWENLDVITVQSLMLPTEVSSNYVVKASDDDFVRSSTSPDEQIVDPFKRLRKREDSSEISDQDVKIRDFLTRPNAISSELVNEETVTDPTVVENFEGDVNDLSFQGKISMLGPKSPEDLFEDEADDEIISKSDNSGNSSGLMTDLLPENVRKIIQNESRLLKQMQRSLSGVLPPPSVTTSKLTISEILERYHANNVENTSEKVERDESLFLPNASIEEIQDASWPDALKIQGLGVCYNRSQTSEKIELTALDLIERFIGCETVSSYTTCVKSPQSTKKRALKSKSIMQSPGRRLSHLAKRRAIFSSANLKQSGSNPVMVNRQIILNPKRKDEKKLILGGQKVGRTPKRSRTGTPSKKKKIRDVIVVKSTITREQSKRALFQSPTVISADPPKPVVSEDVAKRVEKSKRALFSSPPKKLDRSTSFNENTPRVNHLGEASRYKSLNNLDQMIGHKRKRVEENETLNTWTKMPRLVPSNNENQCPGSSKILKSQSFHVFSQSNASNSRVSLFRAYSDVNESFSQRKLSEHHKQKLLWAVATALKHKNIISSHPDYKKHASNLTRVVKTLFLQFPDDPQINSIQSTSEKLKRIANNHVYSVIKGISYDTIIAKERDRLENLKEFKKLDGYIAPHEYSANLSRRNSSNIFYSDVSSIDSSQFSGSFSQMSTFSEFTQKQEYDENTGCHTTRTSSSKKNGDNFALKENLDVRRSAQKSEKVKTVLGAGAGNVLKAKRQISFDN